MQARVLGCLILLWKVIGNRLRRTFETWKLFESPLPFFGVNRAKLRVGILLLRVCFAAPGESRGEQCEVGRRFQSRFGWRLCHSVACSYAYARRRTASSLPA